MSLSRQQKRAQKSKIKKAGKGAIAQDDLQTVLSSALQLHQQGQVEQAQKLYLKLANVAPNDPEIKHLLGVTYFQKGDFEKSAMLIQQAVKINPDNPAYYNNLGNALTALERYDDAIYAYEEAIELREGNYPEATNNVGAALHQRGQWQREIEHYKKGLEFNPYNYSLINEAVKTMRDACKWDDLQEYIQTLCNAAAQSIQQNVLAPITPYSSLTLDISPELKKQIAVNYATLRYGNIKPAFNHKRKPNSRIRIGYVSADYRDHPTAHLIKGLFKYHDRDKFEVYAYSYGKNDESDFRKNIEKNVDHFVDVEGKTIKEIATCINHDKIDILMDVMGYIQNAMPAIFALRPAPVQISYLAYPGTMGATFIDYLVTDRIAVPEETESNYTEKLLLMPDTYFITDNEQKIATAPTRGDCGLPEDKFVFCCFNKTSKIDEITFTAWMDILKQTPDSVLWLYSNNDYAKENLINEAQKHGIEKERIIFASRASKAEHLARHTCADLFLDCFTVNAHTTAIDALYAGLPLITKAGDHIISRASASILNACGLPELVTTTQEDFKKLALKYASDKAALADLRKKLSSNIKTSPLFNTQNYVKNLEERLLEVTN